MGQRLESEADLMQPSSETCFVLTIAQTFHLSPLGDSSWQLLAGLDTETHTWSKNLPAIPLAVVLRNFLSDGWNWKLNIFMMAFYEKLSQHNQ